METIKSVQRSWTRHFITQTSAVIILGLTFAASLFILQSASHIKHLFHSWGKINESTVYIATGTDTKKLKEIRRIVESKPFVLSVRTISSEGAANAFSKKFSQFLPQGASGGEIAPFFPITLNIFLKKPIYTDEQTQEMALFASSLRQRFSEVEEVSYGRSWMVKYLGLLEILNSLSWALGLVIFLASLFVANSALKTVLFARKEEIEILELCGATSSWVYGPQLINCCIITSVAFSIAVFINYGAYSLLAEQFAYHFSANLQNAKFLSTNIIVGGFFAINLAILFTAYLTISGLTIKRKAAI